MFKFHCSRCHSFIKEVSGSEAKEIDIANESVCKACLAKEQKFNVMAEKLQRSWDGKIRSLIADAKKEIVSELEKV